jgi:predicted polyphosphate/ATP-dependent NAD kinase|tara:strand:+ start:8879 stop:9283 length:405 start_codon:yes stop_codon:yes gene_type:complete
MKILVCGGRAYGLTLDEENAILDRLLEIHINRPITKVITGGAKGVDTVAIKWAKQNQIPLMVYEADWNKNGKAAGPIRNARMLACETIDLVVAFPGGKGTEDMVHKASTKEVPVLIIRNEFYARSHGRLPTRPG